MAAQSQDIGTWSNWSHSIHSQERAEHSELMYVYIQCAACFLYSYTIQYPLTREGWHPLLVGFSTNQDNPS